MNENLIRARFLCLDQAENFIEAAACLDGTNFPHIIYHLSLLALEEVGKASMLGAQMLNHAGLDNSWIERSLDNHRRKLQWAVWSPMTRIDPADFEAAHQFASRAHAMRLGSLYVDAKAEVTDPPPRENVRTADATQALALARSRLKHERDRGIPGGEIDELTEWFLDTMADPERSRALLSKSFIAQYEAMGADARKWVSWAKDEVTRLDTAASQLLQTELARPRTAPGAIKPRWRANATIYTPSHSLRSKALARWNDQIEAVQLIWTGRKDELTLQTTLHDNEPLPSLFGRLSTLMKLVAACLNIGTIGYFWFERPGFERNFFKEVRDLELGHAMVMAPRESFWGNGRAIALTEKHIDHAIHCMMAFAPLSEADAEPIFAPYLNGLALIAKSDIFYNFDELARHQFVHSLAGALRHYGGWSGRPEEFEDSFHRGFTPFMPMAEHREKMLQSLRTEGNRQETSLANLRTAKQVADLYLVHTAERRWPLILESTETG